MVEKKERTITLDDVKTFFKEIFDGSKELFLKIVGTSSEKLNELKSEIQSSLNAKNMPSEQKRPKAPSQTPQAPTQALTAPLVLENKLALSVKSKYEKAFFENSALQNTLELVVKKFAIPKEFILTTIRRESGFNPNAKNPASTAKGLGQFLNGTWSAFKKENPEFTGDQTDPIASLHAIAWYFRNIADSMHVDPSGQDAWKIFLAYHLGVGGAKKALVAYQKDPHNPEYSQKNNPIASAKSRFRASVMT